jgi:PPIC-type PPIASE domain
MEIPLFGRIIREPLLQFLAIGLFLFLLYGAVSGGKWQGERRIVINDATVTAIADRYRGLWQRPPTAAELQGLINSYVSDEVRYREGLALGLDKDDPVVRQRVLQKLDVISEESTHRAAPTEAQLQAYLQGHADVYALPGTVGFDQATFNPAHHGSRIQADMSAALERLRAGTAIGAVGDSSLLPSHVAEASLDQVVRDFGEEFVSALNVLPVGTWEGPVHSTYGLHLVRIAHRSPGRPATLTEARAAVERDYENEQRLRAAEEYERRLRQHYDIVFAARMPAGAGTGTTR